MFLFNSIENSGERIALQWSIIYNLVIIVQSFATSWKYFPVTPLHNWIVFPVLNRGYQWYFPNVSEIYYKKMFAYFQVALGRSVSGNIGALCLGWIWHDTNKLYLLSD